MRIEGNTDGIKKQHLEELDALIGSKSASFCDGEIVAVIARVSAFYHREVMINIARSGQVLDVLIGSFNQVAGCRVSDREGRLSGIRNLHTHPNGAAALSDLDYSCLLATRSDAMTVIAVDENGFVAGCVTAYGTPDGVEEIRTRDLEDPELTAKIIETDARWKAVREGAYQVAADQERAVLVGVQVTDEDLEELKELARAAGVATVSVLTQNKPPVPSTLIGSGKLSELRNAVQLYDADVVIFDNALTGSQAVRLEDALGVKVLDRSNLILDVFALRAKSREGKLQVELAQLKYNLPRLIGSHGAMDKMRSGVGMRGPGEKKLETDRRKIRGEIVKLEREIKKLTAERALRRDGRTKGGLPQVSLVGYTNAGKSTLMRALSGADVFVADQLFATLDPLTRRIDTPEGGYLLTDTVGFVSKLPHELIDAFSSTLEEARLADLLLVVLDMADPACAEKRRIVEETLLSIGAGGNPRLYVYNKADLVVDPFFGRDVNTVTVSARTGEGMEWLKQEIAARLRPAAE